jgi:hypothetical protein
MWPPKLKLNKIINDPCFPSAQLAKNQYCLLPFFSFVNLVYFKITLGDVTPFLSRSAIFNALSILFSPDFTCPTK